MDKPAAKRVWTPFSEKEKATLNMLVALPLIALFCASMIFGWSHGLQVFLALVAGYMMGRH